MSSKASKRSRAVAQAALLAVGLLSPTLAGAATFTWDGGGNSNNSWTLNSNWTGGGGGTAPSGTGYDVLFGTGGGSANLNVAQTIANLTFNRAVDFAINGSQTLTINTGITVASAHTYSIAAPIVLGGSNAWNVSDANGTLLISGGISGNQGLSLSGTGTVVISGTVGYGGVTTITGGTLSINSLANGGANSGIGSSSNAASNLILNGGALRFTGTGSSTDRLFTLGSAGTLDASGSGSVNFNGSGSISFTGTTAKVLTLSGTSSQDNTLGVIIRDQGASTLTSVQKLGTGKWILNGLNTYTGVTTISSGVLEVTNLANGGQASGIGSSSNASGNLVLANGTLRYTGAAASTDRLFRLNGDGTFDASGTGALSFLNGGSSASDNTDKQITLTGSNTDDNTMGVVIVDAGSSSETSLLKTGAGKWVLTKTNTYAGATTINQGTLAYGVSNVISDNSNVIVTGANAVLDLTANHSDTYSALQLTGGGLITGTGTTAISIGGTSFDMQNGTVDVRLNGSSGLNKSTTGTVLLSSASNGYTGATTITSGVLQVAKLTDSNQLSSIGSVSSSASNAGSLHLGGGTLRYIGTGDTTNRLFTIDTTGTIDASGSGPLNFNNGTNALAMTSGANRTLTLAGTSTADNTLAPLIPDVTGGTVSLAKSGVGKWILTNTTNSYEGSTTINGGILEIKKLGNSNAASSIGSITASASNAGSLVIDGGTLRYTGAGDTTNRLFTIGTGGATIDASGAASIHFNNSTNNLVANGSGNRTLTLTGSSIADNTLVPVIANPGSGSTSLSKSGTGKWMLKGSNTYSGGTTINSGTLSINNTSGSGTGSGSVTVKSGGALAGAGFISGATTVEASGILSPGNSFGKITFSDNLTLSPSAIFNVQIGGTNANPLLSTPGTAGTNYDQVFMSGSGKTFTIGGATLNILPLSGITVNQAYTIVATGGSPTPATVVFSNFFSGLTNHVLKNQGALKYTVDASSSAITITFTAVPEPSAMGLLMLGAAGVLKRRRRR